MNDLDDEMEMEDDYGEEELEADISDEDDDDQ